MRCIEVIPLVEVTAFSALCDLFRAQWHYALDRRPQLALAWTFFAIAQTIVLVGRPILLMFAVALVEREGLHWGMMLEFSLYIGAQVPIEILYWAFHGPARYIEENVAFWVQANYRRHLLRGVFTLSHRWHTDHHTGDTYDRIEKGRNGLYDASRVSFLIIYSGMRCLICWVMLSYFSPASFFSVPVFVGVGIAVILYFDRILSRLHQKINEMENNIGKRVFDILSNILTVIILRNERPIFASIMNDVEAHFTLTAKRNKTNELKWMASALICNTMFVFVLVTQVTWSLRRGDPSTLAEITVVMRYGYELCDLFYNLAGQLNDVLTNGVKLANASVLEKSFTGEKLENHVLPNGWQKIMIQDLKFTHREDGGLQNEGKDDPHLFIDKLALSRNMKIAVVGQSGSGKSTFFRVFRGLIEPDTGHLEIDGSRVATGFCGIKRAITLIPPESDIFAETVRNNISMFADISDERVWRALATACVDNVVRDLPNGLDTVNREDGVNLSSGQQQRIALARGILASDGDDKEIILLDEPTSAFDQKTEMRIVKNILHMFDDKTVIASTHNLRLVPLFDRVLVFCGGRIEAFGTVDEVRAMSSEYRLLEASALAGTLHKRASIEHLDFLES